MALPDHILAYGISYQFNEDESWDAIHGLGYPENKYPYFFRVDENSFIISEPNSVFIVAVAVDTSQIELLNEKQMENYIPLELDYHNIQTNSALAQYVIDQMDDPKCHQKKTQYSKLWKKLYWPIKTDQPNYIVFQKYDLYKQVDTHNKRVGNVCTIL
jgi:hypothetical protein